MKQKSWEQLEKSEKKTSPSVKDLVKPKTVLSVLCVDNEQSILDGMEKLLTRWNCRVITATDYTEAKKKLAEAAENIDIIFADYQLDTAETGLDLLIKFRETLGDNFMGYIITADRSSQVRDKILATGFQHIQKPVEPAALRAALLNAESQAE